MYKLGHLLDKRMEWWEHIDMSSREFNFFALGDGLVISALICEDIARPDPVAHLLSAVGPQPRACATDGRPQVDWR